MTVICRDYRFWPFLKGFSQVILVGRLYSGGSWSVFGDLPASTLAVNAVRNPCVLSSVGLDYGKDHHL
jgi:hypothetical protein